MNKILELSFPLSEKIMTTVRLTAGGVCALCGLDLDTSEDCKVCITESLLLLLHRGYRDARICFSRDERLYIRIGGETPGEETGSAEDEISLALLGALVGEETGSAEDEILGIRRG